MESGDVVALMHGSSLPLILRAIDSHYIIMGPCYVHGIMDGENLEWDELTFTTIDLR
jgi:hypothetical protein